MDVSIKQQPELRVGTVRHIGPYEKVSHAFERLGAVMTAGQRPPHPQLLALYYDDPQTTPAERLRSDAALTFPAGSGVPAGLIERRVPAGKYASAVHVGPYDKLGKAWGEFKTELERRGWKPTGAVSYEIYLDDPMSVPAAKLKTELFTPIE
jgi:AraC family transcriptional regulator